MKIRSHQSGDYNAILNLWSACNLTRSWNDPQLDIARKLSVQAEWFLVGLINEEIIASAMFGYDGHRGWVNYLAVLPEHQGKGFARKLMTHGENLLKAAGCPKINLQIRQSNIDVMKFYEELGYTKDDVVSYGKRLIHDD